MNKVITASLSALLTLAVTAGAAFASPVPTLTKGARGQDVATMQQLLTFRGEPVPTTGVMGSTTEGLIEQFQANQNLTPTGEVDLSTWHTLTPTLRVGHAGLAVQAFQEALRVKHTPALKADGTFGPATEWAVRDFQAHTGLTADGIVGQATWDALNGHFEELPWSGPGFYRYQVGPSDSSWGTSNTVSTLELVAKQWQDEGHAQRIGLNDMSLPHGGEFAPHSSHQKGMDADIRPLRTDGAEVPTFWTDGDYSRPLTQQLVNMLWATGEVEVILFNDPNIDGVQPWPDHDHHLHVRFKR